MNTLFETSGDGGVAGTHDWLTPPHILEKLGAFDLDPCASQFQPWKTATVQYTIEDDGLSKLWHGRVWCNPPYGAFAAKWLERLAAHGNGIALVFARTDTKLFHEAVFPRASGILFIKGRLSFCLPDGKKAGTSGAPSVLISYGADAAKTLRDCGIEGYFQNMGVSP